MSKFVASTIQDIRGGRETWRVLSLFTAASFAISIIAALVR